MKFVWNIGISVLMGFLAACFVLWLFVGILHLTIGDQSGIREVIDTGVPKLVLTLVFSTIIAIGRFKN